MEEIYISRLELQRWFLEFIISFLRYIFRIWAWGLANSWGSSDLVCSDEFSGYTYFIPNQWKIKIKTFTPENQILIFEEQISNLDFLFVTYTVKKVSDIPIPSRGVTYKLSKGGNN